MMFQIELVRTGQSRSYEYFETNSLPDSQEFKKLAREKVNKVLEVSQRETPKRILVHEVTGSRKTGWNYGKEIIYEFQKIVRTIKITEFL